MKSIKNILKGIILSLVFVFSFTLSSAQSCYTFTQALSVGSRGGEVTRVQSFLYQNGYLPVAPTGYFGNLTHNAVKQYQASKGLDTVGNVGPLTRQALSVDTCSYSSNTNNVSAQNSNLYTNTQATNNNYVVPVSFTSLDEVVTLNIPYGSLLNLPTLQTRSKYPTYTFSGWYSDPTYTTQYNSQLPVSNSFSLYAKWTKTCTTGVAVFPNDCPDTNNDTNVNGVQTKQCLYNGMYITIASSLACPTSTTNATNTNPNNQTKTCLVNGTYVNVSISTDCNTLAPTNIASSSTNPLVDKFAIPTSLESIKDILMNNGQQNISSTGIVLNSGEQSQTPGYFSVDPETLGFKFVGWRITTTHLQTETKDVASTNKIASKLAYFMTRYKDGQYQRDTTYYAIYKKDGCGEYKPGVAISCAGNNPATEGYTFQGWYNDFYFTNFVSNDMNYGGGSDYLVRTNPNSDNRENKIYAKWTKICPDTQVGPFAFGTTYYKTVTYPQLCHVNGYNEFVVFGFEGNVGKNYVGTPIDWFNSNISKPAGQYTNAGLLEGLYRNAGYYYNKDYSGTAAMNIFSGVGTANTVYAKWQASCANGQDVVYPKTCNDIGSTFVAPQITAELIDRDLSRTLKSNYTYRFYVSDKEYQYRSSGMSSGAIAFAKVVGDLSTLKVTNSNPAIDINPGFYGSDNGKYYYQFTVTIPVGQYVLVDRLSPSIRNCAWSDCWAPTGNPEDHGQAFYLDHVAKGTDRISNGVFTVVE